MTDAGFEHAAYSSGGQANLGMLLLPVQDRLKYCRMSSKITQDAVKTGWVPPSATYPGQAAFNAFFTFPNSSSFETGFIM